MAVFGAGFALGFSLILAIGAQNAFVLRQGIRREYVLPVVLTCAISDAILIAAGVAGFGYLVQQVPWLHTVMLIGGVAFLVTYGARAFWSAFKGQSALAAEGQQGRSMGQVVGVCLAFTWLNPHVYLDTVVLIGSIAAQYENRLLFALGAMSASFVFFFSLGFGARLLAPLFARPVAWRWLDAIIGVVMWAIAASLLI